MITKKSWTYDEEGKCIKDEKKSFHLDYYGKIRTDNFDEVIRNQVYKILKYRGCY